jgi:hypothetical protein
MRIFLHRALALLLPAVASFPGVAQAEYFTTSAPAPKTYPESYYSQSADEGNHLTGTTQDQAKAPAAAAPATGSCGTCCWDDCCTDYGTWRDNTILSIGGEAFKSIGDAQGLTAADGFMNSAGFVGTVNTGFTLIPDSPIRGQIGGSYGVYDLFGRDTTSPSSAEQQTFLTMGVSKRSNILAGEALSWGAVYDQMWDHQYGLTASEVYLGQVRGLLGWAVSDINEFGVWGAFRTTGDNSTQVFGGPLHAQNQYNAYWRRNFEFGGQSMLYLGGNDNSDIGSWLFGALGQAPLSDSLSLYGNFVFDFPGSGAGNVGSNELEWAFGVGLSYFLGGKAFSPSVSGAQGLPLLPVANNGSFLISN